MEINNTKMKTKKDVIVVDASITWAASKQGKTDSQT